MIRNGGFLDLTCHKISVRVASETCVLIKLLLQFNTVIKFFLFLFLFQYDETLEEK